MATERQIAANRANTRKSTGPKTAAGRLKSNRNALRHGLSLPLRLDMETYGKADAIARALTRDQTDQEHVLAATELAQAQRIRTVQIDGGGRPGVRRGRAFAALGGFCTTTNASPRR